MNYLKRIGFGVIIWAAIFVVISILVALNLKTAWLIVPLGWIITIVLGWYLSKALKINGLGDGILTGILFAIPALILDYFITAHYTGMAIFGDWNIWVGYALLILIPTYYGSKTK